ncbi:hypothetical protein B0H15DRAFT_287340 [Mycena belliarum]|uniref:Uncharacterized protein n=1 Tax=Mycena belliarum TaxID=1033014 RepID=A0AAD6U5U9_9AGAR|nr:hypothetical protein B0H15DRAFT_287340 [Mycena belliae]
MTLPRAGCAAAALRLVPVTAAGSTNGRKPRLLWPSSSAGSFTPKACRGRDARAAGGGVRGARRGRRLTRCAGSPSESESESGAGDVGVSWCGQNAGHTFRERGDTWGPGRCRRVRIRLSLRLLALAGWRRRRACWQIPIVGRAKCLVE